ncbi:hypothetical protein D3C84_819350 [compost metagenome]
MQQQASLSLGFIDPRLRQYLRRNDPFRQVIQPLESAPASHGDFTSGEQPFQRMLFRAPVPPGASSLLTGRQAAGAQRALLLNRSQHPANGVLLLTTETRHLLINVFATGRTLHTPAHQRVHRQGQQRRLVAPVFKQRATSP